VSTNQMDDSQRPITATHQFDETEVTESERFTLHAALYEHYDKMLRLREGLKGELGHLPGMFSIFEAQLLAEAERTEMLIRKLPTT
jgi:hypothetical protein